MFFSRRQMPCPGNCYEKVVRRARTLLLIRHSPVLLPQAFKLSNVSIHSEDWSIVSELANMKERATVVCWRQGRILLVERGRSRWALPGGTIRRNESPIDAAKRELSEETTLSECELGYLFQFGGLNKRHHVFYAVLPRDARPQPGNEILVCRWFRPGKVATLLTSVPTREIVNLIFGHKDATI